MSNEIVSVDQELTPAQLKQTRDTNMETAMVSMFQLDPAQLNEAKSIANLYTIKHGLTAAIPILCKDHSCPYVEVCNVSQSQRILGGRCLHEIAAMVSRFESLCLELNVNDGDSVDIGLVKDVVDIEMMMLRIDKKFAISGDVMADVWVAVDNFGRDHTAKAVDPLIDIKLKMYDKKMKILEKLNSTRKDKIEEMKKKKDPSIRAASLMAKAKMISTQIKNQIQTQDQSVDIIEVELEEDTIEEQAI